jgi:hypothetical protein
MLSRFSRFRLTDHQKWLIGIVAGVIGTVCGIVITLLTWQFPKSPADSPSISDFQDAAYQAVEAHFKRAKAEEVEKKYVRRFHLTSYEDWVDTGIVLKRNQKILLRRSGEEAGTRQSSNFWAVRSNVWDADNGYWRCFSDRWDDHGGTTAISTNEILGTLGHDTLKIAAYWSYQNPINIEIITDYEKFLEEYSYSDECSL